MENQQLQEELFHQVKLKLSGQASLADEVSKVLGLSTDSAYRRIRGETPVDLQEAQKLCNAFGISLDNLMSLQDDRFIFTSNLLSQDDFDFSAYLRGVLRSMQYFLSFDEKNFTMNARIFRCFTIFIHGNLQRINITSG